MNTLIAFAVFQNTARSWDVRSVWIAIPHGLIWWLFIGLLAGWLAGKMARGHGFGCIGDILIGLIGSVIGGWIFTQLGIGGHANTFLYSLAAATVGAVLLVAVAHLFFGGKG